MKAKRILSLLLTVAMIAACTTAFAAPTGYESYVQSATVSDAGVAFRDQAINANGEYPDAATIRMDLSYEKVDDDRVLENLMGLNPYEDLGIDEKWAGKAYAVTASLDNIGTVYGSSNNGFKVASLAFGLKPLNGAEVASSYLILSTILGDEELWEEGIGFDGEVINIANGLPGKTNVKNLHPTSGSTTSAEDYVTFIVYAEEGTTLSINNALVNYVNYASGGNAYVEGTTTPFNVVSYALWHPETITLGEAADDGDDNEGDDNEGSAPTIGDTKTPETSTGIKVSESKTYDNAMMATASVTINDATEVGILFIPDWVTTEGVLDWSKAAKATVSEDVVSNGGTVEVKAALVKIPRRFENDTINIISKAYAQVGNETPVYGTEVTTALTFGNTGE